MLSRVNEVVSEPSNVAMNASRLQEKVRPLRGIYNLSGLQRSEIAHTRAASIDAAVSFCESLQVNGMWIGGLHYA